MRYLVRLLNARHSTPEQADHISIDFNETVSKSGVSLKNFRVSEYAIEFDLFAENEEMLREVVRVLVSQNGQLLNVRDLSEEQEFSDKQHVVTLTRDLFNEQRYWECHEVMESIWRMEENPAEKDVQQGVILAASAMVHAQRNELSVCLSMLTRAVDRLKKSQWEDYLGLDVDALQEDLTKMLETKQVFSPRV